MRRSSASARLLLAGFLAVLLIQAPVRAETAASPTAFDFTWSDSPSAPQPWHPADWDVIVHSRDTNVWNQLDPMEAQHGPDCSPPPATHTITSYDDAVYICRKHMMTAINAGGYGVIYLSPNRLIDFSAGTASIKYSVSTQRSSPRDWQDIWITAFDDNLVLPLYRFPDLQGPPRNAVHFQLVPDDTFNGNVFRNFVSTDLPKKDGTPYDRLFPPSATQRSFFELDISRTHLRFGMPAYQLWWIDTDIPDLRFSQGVVQFGHHSYNPTKATGGQPGTWHWGGFSMSSAVPFTMLRGDLQSVNADTRTEVCFAGPAPDRSFLRFAGIGTIQVSFNGGRSYVPAQLAAQVGPRGDGALASELFASYWTPVPAGTSGVIFRGSDWWGGPWWVRDPAIWSLSASGGQSSVVLCPAKSTVPPPVKTARPAQSDGLSWLTNVFQRLHALDHSMDGRIGRRNVELAGLGVVTAVLLLAATVGFTLGPGRRRSRRRR